MFLRELGGLLRIARQEGEEFFEALRIESEHGRQLPEEGA